MKVIPSIDSAGEWKLRVQPETETEKAMNTAINQRRQVPGKALVFLGFEPDGTIAFGTKDA